MFGIRSVKKIVFSPAEIKVLRLAAERKGAELMAAGLHPKKVYEEERLEFVTEYMRGAEPASSRKKQAWLRRIKREVRSAECGVKVTRRPI
jgi:hypothetical protein